MGQAEEARCDSGMPDVGMREARMRRAEPDDLPALKDMYAEAVAAMRARGLDVWDDVYPCCALDGDVARGALWLLEVGRADPAAQTSDGLAACGCVFVAAFALADEHIGSDAVAWREAGAQAVYLDRLVVRPSCTGRGYGRAALEAARGLACGCGAAWLRLFVVDANEPARRFYERCGCTRADGLLLEDVDVDLTLREYGYELDVR